MTTRINLNAIDYTDKEKNIAKGAGFVVSAWRYASGIAAVKIASKRGHIIVTPFRGHQIWRCVMDGRDLTMKSMFEEPVATPHYLETYGAFFLHCGATAIGAPGPNDRHTLHGELPLAPYLHGWIEIDETKKTCAIIGTYQHTVAFSYNYLATSTYVMEANSTLLDVSLSVENLKKTSMDLMYLAHANFRPINNAELFYTAKPDSKNVRVRKSIPGHITPKPGYKEFLEALADNPSLHHKLKPGLGFDPEVAMMIDMKADRQGFAHALLRRPDGSSDYIRYQPKQASQCVRWICRTPDQDAIGMAFPATSEVEGYTAEKKKGLFVHLGGGKTWRVDMTMGALDKTQTIEVMRKIKAVKA